MSYVALYRKWRPGNFEYLVGQDHISKTLSNAIHSGKIAHAYLFSGPRGTGKTSTAKILAKALNCAAGPTPTPCNACVACKKIGEGSSMDVFEIDAASNRGIDEIRELRETVKFTPVDGRYKVYIIDEVHMLTTEAFNALLKTLEEPPAHVVFILATTEAHKVPATIHSRCQRYDFKRIDARKMADRLRYISDQSRIDVKDDALALIAAHADGGMRDALSILDQCSALDDECVTAEKVRRLLGLVGHEWIARIVQALALKDAKEILLAVEELIAAGKDVVQILGEIALYLRGVMICQSAENADGCGLYGDELASARLHAKEFTYEQIAVMIEKIHAAMNEAKWSPQPRIAIEVVLLSFCRQPVTPRQSLEELFKRVEMLERKLADGAGAASDGFVNLPRSEPPAKAPREISAIGVQENSSAPKKNEKREIKLANLQNPDEIWDRMLKELIKNGKRSVYACVSQGSLRSLNEREMTIGFSASFPKERTEKSDYKEILEMILYEISGCQIRVKCTKDTGVKETTQAAPKKQPEPAEDRLTQEEQHVIDAAVQMFGDHFVNKEEIEK